MFVFNQGSLDAETTLNIYCTTVHHAISNLAYMQLEILVLKASLVVHVYSISMFMHDLFIKSDNT